MKKYYKELLTEDRPNFTEQILCTIEPDLPICQQMPITPDEVRTALSHMKNKKSPGPGNINIELLKSAPNIVMEILAKIFNQCLEGEEPPTEWKKAVITSIFKKGDRRDCRNYRGISVMCSVARLYGRVLKKRIDDQFVDSEEQNGFRAGRSCIDGIFTLKNLIEKRVSRGRAVHLIFVDLQKAYDTVPLSRLWPCMESSGIGKTYIEAVKALYFNITSSVKLGTRLSQPFQVTKGLRQGCSISPLLFKIYIQEALKSWKRKCGGMGLRIDDDNLYTLFFADDQVIIAEDEDDANYMFRKLKESYEEWGLTINIKKTEYLVVGETPTGDMEVGDCKIKNYDSFKYLGVTLSANGKSTVDITNKICQGRRAISLLNSLLWSPSIRKETKMAIYKSIVMSISTYGAETWELNKRDKDRLMALEMDFLRRSCGISRREHIRNDVIRQMMCLEFNIIDIIDSKRLIWYGHLQRMDESRWPKKIWQWIPPERGKRGRPPRCWKNDIDEAMVARGLQDGDWADRKKWKLRSEKRS